MIEGKTFFGGVPTGPQVQQLMDRFGSPQPGIIAYADIGEVIGESPRTSRFRTILSAWREQLRRVHNVDSEAERTIGVRILKEGERVGVVAKDLRATVRKISRTHGRASLIRTGELTQVELKKHDSVMTATAKIMSVAVGSARQLTSEFRALAARKSISK